MRHLSLALVVVLTALGGGADDPTAAGRLPTGSKPDTRAGFTPSATDSNPRHLRNLGEGSAEMGRSALPRAGTPSTAGSIAFESRSGSNPRLWVVNADTDSVSVFDTVTRKRLAEIPVGDSPRTLALTSNRTAWVTNKANDSVSVIDTSTLTVSRTLSLPPGSQPHGVAALNGGYALVVLEADGMLVRFSTSTYAPTGTVTVGANARHVSISADGGTAYVTRSIGARQPGESKAVPRAGRDELLHVALPALSIVRRVGLAEGDENLAGRSQLFRIDTGLAPQGLALSAERVATFAPVGHDPLDPVGLRVEHDEKDGHPVQRLR